MWRFLVISFYFLALCPWNLNIFSSFSYWMECRRLSDNTYVDVTKLITAVIQDWIRALDGQCFGFVAFVRLQKSRRENQKIFAQTASNPSEASSQRGRESRGKVEGRGRRSYTYQVSSCTSCSPSEWARSWNQAGHQKCNKLSLFVTRRARIFSLIACKSLRIWGRCNRHSKYIWMHFKWTQSAQRECPQNECTLCMSCQ